MTVDQLDLALLGGAAVLLIAVAAVRISARSGLPSLLLYLGIGFVVGLAVPDLVDDPDTSRSLAYAALVLILAEGGITTRWSTLRPALAPATVLATLGVVVSIAVTAVAARFILNVDWQLALLIGAIIASTDAAAVFSVLRNVPLPKRLSGILEAESGFNDAPVILIVVALSTTDGIHGWAILGEAVVGLLGGLAVGLLAGWLGVKLLQRMSLPVAGLYPIAAVSLCVLTYAIAANLHVSGFLAVYLAGIVIGNSQIPHRIVVGGFFNGVAWLAQIGLFVLLGLLVAPGATLAGQILPALALGAALLLVARPLSVLVSLSPFRIPLRHQVFTSWAGLRGAVPIVLATVPLSEGLEDAGKIFDLVFVLVVMFTLIQAPSLPRLARKLGLSREGEPRDLDMEVAPLDRLAADVVEVNVPENSLLHGVEVFELRLPRGANLAMIARGDEIFVPNPQTRIQRGDDLIIVTPVKSRDEVLRRLRAVARGGRMASWRGDRGEELAD